MVKSGEGHITTMGWHALLGGHHGMKYLFNQLLLLLSHSLDKILIERPTSGIVEHYCLARGEALSHVEIKLGH